MEDYVSMKLKNHKEHNKKILFVMLLKPHIDYNKELMLKTIEEYKKHIIENKDLSIIIDTRQLNTLSPKLAWEGAGLASKLNSVSQQNVRCSCLIMEPGIIKTLFNTITKVHPVVVPFKVVSDNKNAMDFVIEKMKN